MNLSRSFILLIVLITALPASSIAGGTRIWELAGFAELQKGAQKGTVLSSLGEVSVGLTTEPIKIEEGLGTVWTAEKNASGDIYIGTGYDGKIFRVLKRKTILVADTGQLAVTALAFDKKGDLFAAALPEPVIWKIASPKSATNGKPAKVEKWATLPEGTKHIWALEFSRDGRTLYAGTGPEGKVFAVGKDKTPQVFFDAEDEHILSMAFDKKENLLVGTSPSAVLYRISGPGRAEAPADFDGVEVKAVVPYKDDIFVAVNDFKTPPKIPSKKSSGSDASKSSKKSAKAAVGDGAIYKIDALSRREKLWGEKKQHITAMTVSQNGTVFAGLGAEGKVVSVDEEHRVRYELDLDERQVTAVIATGDELSFAGCGDAGAAYAVLRARKAEAVYLTPLLDTERVSEWGRVTWFAEGRLKAQSRSGNTLTPDTAWSDWSAPIAMNGLIPSPPARYLQFRFSFADDEKTVLTGLQAAMKSSNLRAVITAFDPGSPFPTPSGSIDETTSDRIIDAKPDPKIDPELSLSWKVKNPDGDDLRYRLWYRAMGEKIWRPILKEDRVLTISRYTWNTESVPEGNYQLKLSVDDSRVNDPGEVTRDIYISSPVLVDNHQPSVKKLTFKNGVISGIATDSFSNIGAIEYSVDNGPWTPVFCTDRIFDETEEAFSFSLPEDLAPGPHAAAVRAFDRGGNMGVAELHITTK